MEGLPLGGEVGGRFNASQPLVHSAVPNPVQALTVVALPFLMSDDSIVKTLLPVTITNQKTLVQ